MQTQLNFTLTARLDENETRNRINEYFQLASYQKSSSDALTYERGLSRAKWYSFSPKKLKTSIIIELEKSTYQETAISLMMEVDTSGAIVSTKDLDFWLAEINELAIAITYNYFDIRSSGFAADRATWYSIAVAALIALVVSMLAILLIVILFQPLCTYLGVV
jgi:hypothetical protein